MGKYDKKKIPSSGGRRPAPRANSPVSDNPELDAVARWLSTVKFKSKMVGGLDPEDVWKKLEILNSLYENALIAERARYNLMLQQFSPLEFPEEYDG